MNTHSTDPAFPLMEKFNCEGLSKRELFAAFALVGHIAADRMYSVANKTIPDSHQAAARSAVQYADALIAALNEE